MVDAKLAETKLCASVLSEFFLADSQHKTIGHMLWKDVNT